MLIIPGFPVIFSTAIIVFCFIKRYFFIFTDGIETLISIIYTVCCMHQAFYVRNHLPTGHYLFVTRPYYHQPIFSQFWVVYILIWILRPLQSIRYNGTFILNETYHAPNGSLSKVGVGGKSKFVILNPLNGFGWKSRLFCGMYWFIYPGQHDQSLSGFTSMSSGWADCPLLIRSDMKIWSSPIRWCELIWSCPWSKNWVWLCLQSLEPWS